MQHERRRFQKARRLATIAALLLCAWMLQGSSTPMLSSLTGGVRMIDVLEAQGETELALGLLHAGSMFPDEEITDLVARERNLRKLRLLVHAGRHAEAYDFMRQAHDWFEGRDLPLLHAALALRTARPESALSALMPMPHLDDPLRSYAFLLRAQALRQTERWEEARQAVSQAHPASLPREFRRRLNLIDATCALQLQHTEGLAELASQLSADARHDDENGLLLARMVEVALARGDTVQGTEWALGLLEARPTPAETAYEMLLDLEGSGRWLPTAEQNILIAHYEMDNDHLLPSARRLLHTLETQSATMQPEQIGEAWVELARTRQMRNQHSRCLELLADKADLIRGTKAEAEMLRLLARSEKSRGNEAAAIDIYRDLARRFPGHPRADDALYEVGWRQEIRAQLSQAERTYGELP